jgi:threonine/homoserine/homoserine lactone efflux protein
MVAGSTLSLFLLAVLVLMLSPGPNMAFVLSHGMALGPRGGLAAALGIAAADLVLTLLTASGVTALLAAWAPMFDLLRYLGALYLLWLAWQAWRQPGVVRLGTHGRVPLRRVFRMAMLGSLLNPKALLFFMVFLPQFVDAGRGDIVLQLTLLGMVLSLVALLFNSALGSCSGQLGRLLQRHPRAACWQRWALAAVLLGLALRLLLLERPLPR